jgi:hypothetical protein
VSLAVWWAERLEKAKTRVEDLEAAVSGLADGSIMSYQLDSGQTRTLVTKQQISQIVLALERALNDVSVLDARVNGSAAARIQPDF